MARKSRLAETAELAEEAASGPLSLKPAGVLSDETPTYYINHADLAAGQYEISLLATRLPTRATPEQLSIGRETGRIEVPAELQLIFPPDLLPGLIRALTAAKDTYEAQFRPIVDLGAPE